MRSPTWPPAAREGSRFPVGCGSVPRVGFAGAADTACGAAAEYGWELLRRAPVAPFPLHSVAAARHDHAHCVRPVRPLPAIKAEILIAGRPAAIGLVS